MAAVDGFVPVASGARRLMPKSGLALQLSRSSSVYANSSVLLIKYVKGVRTVIGRQALPFQLKASGSYSVQLSVSPDFYLSLQISDGTTPVQIRALAGILPFQLDQFFIADTDGGSSFDAPAGDLLMRFDDVEVWQAMGAILK